MLSLVKSYANKLEDLLPANGTLRKTIYALEGAVVLLLTVRWYRRYKKKQRRRCRKQQMKPGIVYFHSVPRGKYVPSFTPFPMKLETYLRINKIPYEIDHDDYIGPKGKLPWITYKGMDIGDTTLIIDFLNKEFKIDMDSSLSPEERAVSRSLQIMTEEHLYWALALGLWVFDKRVMIGTLSKWPPGFRYLIYPLISRRVAKYSYGHGIGRHSEPEIYEMGYKDVKALSNYLGDKPYFMGNKVSQVDSSLFGFLCLGYFNELEDSYLAKYKKLVIDEFPNLKRYCLRMKEEFWPDWDKCLSK